MQILGSMLKFAYELCASSLNELSVHLCVDAIAFSDSVAAKCLDSRPHSSVFNVI